MKLTQVLLAGAVALVASNAMAYDIAHPFWGTSKGQFASETDYAFTRTNYNNDMNHYAQRLWEKVSYGMTDNWTVAVRLSKDWSKNSYDNHNKANEWALGTTYNFINDGQRFGQVGIGYGQQKWEGRDNMSKYYQLNVKGGVDLGKVTPYAEAYIKDTLNNGERNDAAYGLRVAMDAPVAQKTSADVGLGYDKITSADHRFALDAAVSYTMTPNVVGKVYGKFMLHDYEAGVNRAQRSNTIGLNLKAAF